MQTAVYKPSKENTIIIKDLGEYCEVMLGGEVKTVSKDDLEIISPKSMLSSFDDEKDNTRESTVEQIKYEAFKLIEMKKYSEALVLLLQLDEEGVDDESLYYLLGQCYRYLEIYPTAIHYLQVASQKKANTTNLLALGIAMQLDKQYEDAIKIFKKAINVDQNFLLAYNSLALTYKRMGEYQTAADTYERVLQILGYQIIFDMRNSRENEYVESSFSENDLWMQYALNAALYFAQADNIQSILVPAADEPNQYHEYGGLYWVDREDNNKKISRFFLPNYFDTFKMELTRDNMYSSFIGDKGLILELLGDNEESAKHLREAQEFMELYNNGV